MRIVFHLLKMKNESVTFVHAGKTHTINISRILQKIGFVLEGSAEKNIQLDNYEDLLTKDFSLHSKLDITEFIASCKTLNG